MTSHPYRDRPPAPEPPALSWAERHWRELARKIVRLLAEHHLVDEAEILRSLGAGDTFYTRPNSRSVIENMLFRARLTWLVAQAMLVTGGQE